VKTNYSGNLSENTYTDCESHMDAALNLACRGLGNVWPNPAVGCVIVNQNRVVGRGWTLPGGRPHAETEALRRAGKMANGAIAYVTLEPCNHQGQTEPCTEALIKAGIKKIVIAAVDPDERVSGSGIARLKEAGVEVEVGLAQDLSHEINQGFFSTVIYSRPHIILKIATTLDGKIATQSGESKWITGKFARKTAHKLRHSCDAIMIGSGTALADNPSLTSRLPGVSNDRRLRIILDGRLRIPLDGNLVQTARQVPVMVFTLPGSKKNKKKIDCLKKSGVSIIVCEENVKQIDIKEVVAKINSHGITRLLVEGGGAIAASLLSANLVDEIAWFRAPSVMGNDGIAAINGLGLEKLEKMSKFSRKSLTVLDDDCLEILIRTE